LNLVRRIKSQPIGRKLIVLGFLILAFGVGFMSTFLFTVEFFIFRDVYLHQLQAQSALIGYSARAALTFESAQDARETLSLLKTDKNVMAAVLYDRSGRVFSRFGPTEGIPDRVSKERAGDFHWLEGYAEVVEPVRVREETVGYLLIRGTLIPFYRRIGLLALTITMATLLTMAVGLFLVWWMRNIFAGPILRLTQNVKKVGGEMGLLLPGGVKEGDEVDILSSTFDELLDRLRQRDDELAAHRRRLEDLVRERTAALEETNIKLTAELDRRQRSEEEQLRLIAAIQQSAEGIFVTDPSWTILFCNRAFEEMLGYGPGELLGRHTRELKSGVHDQEFYRTIRKTVNAGKVWKGRAVNRRKDGALIQVDVTVSPVQDDRGRFVSFVWIHRDITEQIRAEEERRALEERLQRAEKMEALGTLAGGVAHDLNNVLGVLVGYSELLMMNSPEGSPTRKHAAKILEGGQRAAAIIQDLLTLARRGVPVAEVLNLNDLVNEFLKSMEMEKIRSLHTGVRFDTRLDEGLLNIKGSKIHLTKTLMNLLLNAAESITGAGTVTVGTSNCYLDRPLPGYDEIKEGEYTLLTVADTGTGIGREDLDRIFEPFYTKKVMGRSGTGLGLAVVWGTVKDHNGYIHVESEEGKGTVFSLYFPLCREDLPERTQRPPQDAYRGKGERILVVDDVEEQRHLARSILGNLGYRVEAVGRGEDAVAYLRANEVDLVILDMIMEPGCWDGLDTYREILRVRPGQRAVIVSGFALTDRVREAQRLGAGPYVRKPYVMEQLGMAVRRELDR